MHNFLTLLRYELTKIVRRKLFFAMSVLCLAGAAVTAAAPLLGSYSVNGVPVERNIDAFYTDQAHRAALDGRAIDQQMIDEALEAYRSIPADAQNYTLTAEYQANARRYSEIFNRLRSWTGLSYAQLREGELSEAALYAARMQRIEEGWTAVGLTQNEKNYWRSMEAQLAVPFCFEEHTGWEMLLASFLTIGILTLLFDSVCLSGVFADEHARRTDQLVLSSRMGRRHIYLVKAIAGALVSALAALAMTLMIAALCLGLYGADGAEAAFQIFSPFYSYPLTVAEACIITYAMLLAAAVLFGVFVMTLSELFASSVAALAVSSGLIVLANFVSSPTGSRVLDQIWDWMPMVYLSTWNVFDPRMLTLFDRVFPSWQAIPLLYACGAAVLSVIGRGAYLRYQIGGR